MKLLALVGGSSTGKDEILKSILNLNIGFKPIVSHTTRPMRCTEQQDVEYHFVDVATATEMLNNGEFIETRQYNVAVGETWLYGIHKSELDLESDDNYICIVDFQGLKKIEKYLKANDKIDSLTSIYIDTNYQTRLLRALNREGKMEDIQVLEVIRRFEDDRLFVEPAKEHCDIVLNNNNISDLMNIIKEIIATINQR